MTDADTQDGSAPKSATILCPLCQSEIAADANFCAYCGKHLGKKNATAALRFGVVVLVLLAAGVASFYYLRANRASPAGRPALKEFDDSSLALGQSRRQAGAPEETGPELSADRSLPLTVGLVSFHAITGIELMRIPAAVVAGGWVALPERASLGGYDWQFLLTGYPPVPVEEGIVADEDTAGLWRLQTDLRFESPPLAAWRTDLPLSWVGLGDAGGPEPVEVTVTGQQRHFVKVAMAGDFIGAGLFIQAGRVVGWSFGELTEGGFLWAGAEGRNLLPEIRVDDFYRLRFAGSREEELLRALAMGDDYSELERLGALAGAFRFESKLAPDALGGMLRPAVISERMRGLIGRIAQAGLSAEVAAVFDAEILGRAADADLVLDVVQSIAEGVGYGEAVTLLENTLSQFSAADPADLDRLVLEEAALYRRWLAAATEQQDFDNADQAFAEGRRRFPDDMALHLMGVKLALAQNDWSEAERLLEMKSYPPDLSAEVAGLRAQILNLKAQAGSIVIRFAPGSRQVPVVALLDGAIRQQFIVDTGASMVTIPSDTARELGLIINVRTPRRTVYTAGGAVTAPEVVLTSVDIDGWEVRNVTALVVDLPDNEGWGLLGMNYLRRFRMDLNTEEGLLLLEPR